MDKGDGTRTTFSVEQPEVETGFVYEEAKKNLRAR